MAMKRKEIDEVNDDLLDFSLSSPATKIPRLDAEMAPMMEEDMALPFVPPAEHLSGQTEQVKVLGPVIEELPCEPDNEERALVLFRPMDTPLIQPSSSLSISVDPRFLSHIKNKIWLSKSRALESTEDSDNGNECLAVVPWAPSKIPSAQESQVSELMDADDMGVASMDIEEENANLDNGPVFNNVPNPGECLHQWHQQHCLIPQLPQNTSAPIVWR